MTALLLDGIIACLLAVTIGYSYSLSRKITALHKSRDELNTFLISFNEAIAKAERNIDELKVLGDETDGHLIEHINKARYLANDLSFLMEKGENVADTLEHYISSSRNVQKRPAAPVTPPVAPTAAPTHRPLPPKVAIREPLAQAPRFEEEDIAHNPLSPRLTPTKQKALNQLLDQIAQRKEEARIQQNARKAAAQAQQKAAAQPAQRTRSGWESIASSIIPRSNAQAQNGVRIHADGLADAEPAPAPKQEAAPQKPFIRLGGTPASNNRAAQEFSRQADLGAPTYVRQSIET